MENINGRTYRKDRLQEIWSSLSEADRVVILGHGDEELTMEGRAKLLRVLSALGKQKR